MLPAFNVAYAGLIELQNGMAPIDPTGRTDLLQIIDAAQADGTLNWRFGEPMESFPYRLTLKVLSIDVAKCTGEVELQLPLHLIASICYIHEQNRHLICVSIVLNEPKLQVNDLVLLFAPSRVDAETICVALDQKFQHLFTEAVRELYPTPLKPNSTGVSLSSQRQSPPCSDQLPSGTTIQSIYTQSDSSNEDYTIKLYANLTKDELLKLLLLTKDYQENNPRLLEYLQKTKELFGPERPHLLSRQETGYGQGDAPVDRMSNSARPSSGSSGGIRGFFSKLRKPSDQMYSSNGQTVQVGNRTYDVAELQKTIPQLEDACARKDQQLKQAQISYEQSVKRISELENQVLSLQRECDKLRSVLDQKATSAASPGAPASPTPKTDQLGNDLAQDESSIVKRPTYKKMVSQTSQKAVLPNDSQSHRAKKLAVSAEPTNFDQTKSTSLQHHSKTAGSKHLIRDAVQKNDFLKQLAKEQIIELVECMYEMRARAGQWVIQEGEPGDRLFVVAEGELQVSREGNPLGTMRSGTVMGELAILYNCTRTASIQAITDVQLWVLDRSVFQMITQRLGMERHTQLMNFLSKVSIFEKLNEDRISKIADVLDQDYYAGGHYIIRQGEKGDAFFIINSGQVKVTQLIEGEVEPREIRILGQGDFFGERALLGEEVRTANIIAQAPGVEVLTLDRDSFVKLIGDIEGVKKDYGDKERLATVIHEPPSPVKEDIRAEFSDVKLNQIKRIATLGVGGFGRVELVCLNGDKSRTFALKALKKKHIVDTRQQEHIFAERNIMMETSSDWIVKLYKTFRDTKYVYMLLEVCLGGELWTTLRDRGHFDDYTARFFVACVLEGLEYLHRKNIVYRDLKPENCLLTNTGYLKLVDFGFAKKLASGRKTWTFCGTPEYVSPEIILNKGHDQAADYWALGIYICELMLGRPPFQASDPMKTYTLILKGVDALEIPNRRIGKTATALVKKLCRDNPGERLGSGSGGVNDIRKHRWFMGFDWEGLRSRTLKAPILPKVSNPADVTNFDNYPPDLDVPPDEFSGWDEGF